jgi:arsenate reductase
MSENKNKIKVLFLCTGNACRSQIAEGWAKHLKSDVMEAYSAGIAPGNLNQMAVKIMAEAGVDISKQKPKHVDELKGIDFNYVVTVCDNAREGCPIFPRKTKFIHKSFEDPSFTTGSEQQIKAAFVKLRDQMKEFVEEMPEIFEKESTKQK